MSKKAGGQKKQGGQEKAKPKKQYGLVKKTRGENKTWRVK